MRSCLCHLLIILLGQDVFCQSFLNGDFEVNTAVQDEINISNERYIALMSNSMAFGTLGNVDIISSDDYCGPAQNGRYYIALTGGGTDAISLELSSSIIAGRTYSISFYDRRCSPTTRFPFPVEIGLSDNNISFGSVIYTALNPEIHWTKKEFSFTATENGRFITVRLAAGDSYNTWCQIDNFSIKCLLPFNLGVDTIICNGRELNLSSGVAGASYLWNDGSTGGTLSVTKPGTYWMTGSIESCSSSDTITVGFMDCTCLFDIPNAFSPNGDGINDAWKLGSGTCVSRLRVIVYNRYGSMVFRSDNYSNDWRGTTAAGPLPFGTYYYTVQVLYVDGREENWKGAVTIVR